MADPDHLKFLRKGVKAWNRWRRENPTAVDLSGVVLHGTNLSEVDLSRANLIQADLFRADLSGADLTGAALVWADLSEADLTGACLTGATLIGTNLSRAGLFGANLSKVGMLFVNFAGAFLQETDFSDSEMISTILGDVDLSLAKGLETVEHRGPSTIGLDTIYRSKGNIPEGFARGAGVPADFIAYMKSMVGMPIEFYSCFISYSTKDQDFAERLRADLQSKGVRCWFAPEDLKIGDKFRTRIEDSIRLYDKLLVVLSANSVESVWVEEEVEAALEKERQHPGSLVLFPIRLDEAVMETKQPWAASLRRIRHMGDFRDWKNHHAYRRGFARLLRDLKSESKPGAAVS